MLPNNTRGVPSFHDYGEPFEYLEKASEHSDLAQNARNELYELKQQIRDFSVHVVEFQHLTIGG